MEKHTPLPWHHHDMESNTLCGPDHGSIGLFDARKRSDAENRANTELVLRAVNSHAALVAALEELLECVADPIAAGRPTLTGVVARACAVLATAKGDGER